MGVFRPEFIEALSLLAQVCDEVERKGYRARSSSAGLLSNFIPAARSSGDLIS
jgi:hypothetical protein